ncbi:hypothetical protein GCM10010428_45720 [Actinosynnema pretiosum subsp. pretiosum]
MDLAPRRGDRDDTAVRWRETRLALDLLTLVPGELEASLSCPPVRLAGPAVCSGAAARPAACAAEATGDAANAGIPASRACTEAPPSTGWPWTTGAGAAAPPVRVARRYPAAVTDIVRRSARALLFDADGRLVLIRRTRPGQAPYWVLAGGGVEPGDADHRATVARELLEELGAVAVVGEQVWLATDPTEGGACVAHVHLARLVTMDFAARTGDEPTHPSYGLFEPDVVPLDGLEGLDLRPVGLAEFVVRNALVLGVDAAALPDQGVNAR